MILADENRVDFARVLDTHAARTLRAKPQACFYGIIRGFGRPSFSKTSRDYGYLEQIMQLGTIVSRVKAIVYWRVQKMCIIKHTWKDTRRKSDTLIYILDVYLQLIINFHGRNSFKHFFLPYLLQLCVCVGGSNTDVLVKEEINSTALNKLFHA